MNDVDGGRMAARLQVVLDPVPVQPVAQPTPEDIKDLIPGRLRPAAVLVPLVPSVDGWELVLTRRTAHLKHHAGQVAFPGGRMERQDRSLVETALREAREEIGLVPESVEVIGALATLPTITGFQVVPVVGIVPPDKDYTIDRNEVDEVFSVPLDFALDPDNQKRQSAVFRGRRRSFFVIQYRQHTIWGATAAMLVNFSERIRAAE